MKVIVPIVLSLLATTVAVVIARLIARRDIQIDPEGLPAAV